MPRRRPSPAFVLAFLALLVSLSGVGYAAIPAKDGDVHLCYSKTTGEVTVVDTQRDNFDCEKSWVGFTFDTKPTRLVSPNGEVPRGGDRRGSADDGTGLRGLGRRGHGEREGLEGHRCPLPERRRRRGQQ